MTQRSVGTRATLVSVASLLLSYGTLLLANGLFNTLLGLRTTIEGFPTQLVGIIMAAYFLGLLLGALHAARVVSRVGHIRSFAAFASVMSVSALAHPLLVDPWWWMLLRALSGFCMAGMIMVTESWLNARASNANRGQVLSFYMITNYAAAGSAQFLLNLSDPGLFHLFSLASILFSLALLPVLLTRAAAPAPGNPERIKLRTLYRISPLGTLGAFSAGMVNATFYGMAAVFTREVGLSVAQTSLFMASAILGGLLLQWPAGWLSDRFDRRWVVIGVSLGTAVACVLIVVASGRGSGWLYLATVIYGAVSFTVYSLSAAHTNDFAGPERLIQVAGGLLLVYGLGAVAGPVLGAFFMGVLGPDGLFMFSAAVSGGLGLFAAWRMRQRPTAQRGRFVPIPSAQYSSKELYRSARDQMDRDLAGVIGGYPRR